MGFATGIKGAGGTVKQEAGDCELYDRWTFEEAYDRDGEYLACSRGTACGATFA